VDFRFWDNAVLVPWSTQFKRQCTKRVI
jgi:hypothetical protein